MGQRKETHGLRTGGHRGINVTIKLIDGLSVELRSMPHAKGMLL